MDLKLDAAAHLIQLALTPIFLLGATGTLLNVFSTRLGRISDRIHAIRQSGGHATELARLRARSRVLDAAVVLAALAGGLTCCAALALFVENLRGADRATLILSLFGGALVSAIAALAAYAVEILLAGRRLREEA